MKVEFFPSRSLDLKNKEGDWNSIAVILYVLVIKDHHILVMSHYNHYNM
jgi:hypothetical protein